MAGIGLPTSHRGIGFDLGIQQFHAESRRAARDAFLFWQPSPDVVMSGGTMPMATHLRARHGSAEQGRDRERDRDRRPRSLGPWERAGVLSRPPTPVASPRSQAEAFRQIPAGAQEQMDWGGAHKNAISRIL